MIGYIVLGVAVLFFLIFILPGFTLIGANQVGILTRKMGGNKLPAGHVIATKGENGIQAPILMPGFYWRFPLFWKFTKVPVTIIMPGHIGIMESIDGEPLPPTRLLGDEVESNSFQDAKLFLDSKGKKGPQVAILRPGTYRINTLVFHVIDKPATDIDKEKIGMVTALDGSPLLPGYIIAPKGEGKKDHKFYQDGQAFIDDGGYRGTQLDTLQPGEYYINPLLFEIKTVDIVDVPPGYVAVIRSNVGLELERDSSKPEAQKGEGKLESPIHEEIENILILDKTKRGIWREPVAPGKYNLNSIAFTPYLVPTSAVTIDWAAEGRIGTEVKGVKDDVKEQGVLYKFDPLKVTSKDGFQLEVNVRMVIRIQPANAAYIIARFGSVVNLIDQIVHPLIDSSFRNKAGEKKAIDFFQSRTDLQTEALAHAREKFAEYNVEAQNLLIAYIDIPSNLLETQTAKEIALQQQAQYDQQALAQEKRIGVAEKEARANKQKDVIDAKLAIDIKSDYATARMKEAEGEATYLEKTNAAVGMGLAKGYEAQKEALGEQGTTIVNIYKALAEKNIPIVPTTLVGGDGGNIGGLLGILSARFGQELANKQPKKVANIPQDTPEKKSTRKSEREKA